MISALLFLVGALGGMALGRHLINHGRSWTGSLLMIGSGWNALFIPIPLILAQLESRGQDIASIGTDIALSLAIFGDAMFNGLMGVSLVLLANSLKQHHTKLGWSGIVIGIMTTCVVGQFEFTAAADLLKVAGFLWLGWWLIWGWTVGLSDSSNT
jgi:predicted permease